jgi:transcriptional regulator with XRE-family HTH domain
MTMAAFGAAVGISESAVSYLEKGRSRPRYDTLEKLNEFAEKLRATNGNGKNGHKANGKLAGAAS